MQRLSDFLRSAASGKSVSELKAEVKNEPGLSDVYPDSIHEFDRSILFLARTERGKKLFVVDDRSRAFRELEGVVSREDGADAGLGSGPGGGTGASSVVSSGFSVKECDLSVANSRVIRRLFPFTNPVSLQGVDATLGVGDRLGLASPGHIRTVRGTGVKPVLAQQSIRELTLTGRTFDQVLSDVVWAVFQEDYREGYGADGDHLKTMDEVRLALDAGYTMITLDCSNYIRNLGTEEQAETDRLYAQLEESTRRGLEELFLQRPFVLESGRSIEYTPETLRRNAVVYQRAIEFAIQVYDEFIRPISGRVDYEMSIDETTTPTDPAAHFFVALQLSRAGVKVNSLAPRFCGEFQKGIDYIGDIGQFEREFQAHADIAKHFGYKLSIHSGSDKFSVFPIIGKCTGGRVHVKTAGTNWLEAVRVIIEADPGLYREFHQFALTHLDEARRYYHVTLDTSRVPDVRGLSDTQLGDLMNQSDARQLIHICYGLILQARGEDGQYVFRDRIYRCLYEHEAVYYRHLESHIGRHLRTLGFVM